MPTAEPIRVFQLITEGRTDQAAARAGALRAEPVDVSANVDPDEVTRILIASFVDTLSVVTPRHADSVPRALAFVRQAEDVGRLAWAAAGRALAALAIIESGEPGDALGLMAQAEADLATERAREEPLDPPGGPTGPGAAANNLGSVYVELGLFERAEAHLLEAARISSQLYGPEYAGQAVIDEVNLVVLRYSWATDCDADEDPRARDVAAEALTRVRRVAARAQALDWQTLADFVRVVELGCLSIVDPDALPAMAPHEVRAIMHTSATGGLLHGAMPLMVLARLCRLAGDVDGAVLAAQRIEAEAYGPADPCLAAGRREAMLATVPSGAPAVDYAAALRSQLNRQRADLQRALDQRIEALARLRSGLCEPG